MLTTFVLEAQENLLTWFRIFISWLFCNKEEIGCRRKGYCYGTSFCVLLHIQKDAQESDASAGLDLNEIPQEVFE